MEITLFLQFLYDYNQNSPGSFSEVVQQTQTYVRTCLTDAVEINPGWRAPLCFRKRRSFRHFGLNPNVHIPGV